MGVHEIAELLGVSRQRVDEISRTDERFPGPVDTLRSGRIWRREDVEAWAQAAGRTVSPESGGNSTTSGGTAPT